MVVCNRLIAHPALVQLLPLPNGIDAYLYFECSKVEVINAARETPFTEF